MDVPAGLGESLCVEDLEIKEVEDDDRRGKEDKYRSF